MQKDAPSPAADLEDMQSLLFLLNEADAYRRNGKLNLALKKYMAVKKIFDEFEDDQFDFHGYNLRKFTINIYLKYVYIALCLRITGISFVLQVVEVGRSTAVTFRLCQGGD